MGELKPCPFCGGTIAADEYFTCAGCGAAVSFPLKRDKLSAAWNSRAPSKAERDGVLEVCTEMEVRVDSYAKDYDSLVLNNSTIRDWSSRLRAAMKGRP